MGAALGICTLSAVLLLPGYAAPYHDGAIFAVVGQQWADGSWPYLDVWDHKPPAVYFVAAVAAAMPGPTWPWLWLASAASLAATGWVMREVVGTKGALVAVLSMGLWPAALGGGQTETFAALPAAAAIWAASRERWLGAGALMAISLAFSLQLLASAPFFLVVGGRRLPTMAAGAGVVGLLILVPFGLAGVLPAMADALVTYSAAYLGSDRSSDLAHVYWMVPSLLPFAALVLRRRPLDRIDLGAVAWILCAATLMGLQGRLLSHYIIPIALPLAILLDLDTKASRAVTAIACAFAIVASGLIHQVAPHRSPASTAVGLAVREMTSDGDRILVWGTEAGIYLAAERDPAGRYPYLMPLVTPRYSSESMVEDWVDSLQSDPPRVIVDAEAANPYWDEGDDFLRPPPPGAAGGRTLDVLDSFRTWVAASYDSVTEIRGRKVYQLKSVR